MKHHDEPGPPCSHMKAMLHDAADGHSRGLRLWFALSHAARCGRCGRYLACLREMIAMLRAGKNPIPDDVELRLNSKLAEATDLVKEP